MPSVPRLLQAAPQADGSRWPIRALQPAGALQLGGALQPIRALQPAGALQLGEVLSVQHNTLHPACILCKDLK